MRAFKHLGEREFMPAVIAPNICDQNFAGCFPARICPEGAFSFDEALQQVIIDSSLCGTCPGPCTNFCDHYAIRYLPDPDEFDVLRAQTLGEIDEATATEQMAEVKAAAKTEQELPASGPVRSIRTDEFEPVVLQSELPVVIDFWAAWCGPCQAMAPVFEKLAEQYQDFIRFVKVNIDEEPALAARFRVQSIPTLGFFLGGQLIDLLTGALNEQQLQSVLYEFLSIARQQQSIEAEGSTLIDGEPS